MANPCKKIEVYESNNLSKIQCEEWRTDWQVTRQPRRCLNLGPARCFWALSEKSKKSAPFFRDLKKRRILQVLWRNIRTPTQRGTGQWIGNNLGAASGSGVCVFISIYINCVCIQASNRKRPGQRFGNKLGRGAGPRCLQFATNLVCLRPIYKMPNWRPHWTSLIVR